MPLPHLIALMITAVSTTTIMNMTFPHKTIMLEWTLLSTSTTHIQAMWVMDNISLMLITLVSFISFNIYMFSHYYLVDPQGRRFYLLLMMFIISMFMFATSGNLMMMLLGWDGLGITSFLLVAHYQTHTAAGSSMVTMFTNRIGDALLIMSMYFMMSMGHWNTPHMYSSNMESMILILILTAAATKSAHLPFNLWLPEAMAAPTPVSALVHSSTLVTAGIILTLRLTPLLYLCPPLCSIMWVMGALTTTSAGMTATHMRDPKKIIAYSTMSQLGMMTMALSAGLHMVALAHLVTHAMFKALMFMGAGLHISNNKHKQMLMSNNLRWANISHPMKLSALSLNAFPFTAGFFSKDMILESTISYWTEMFWVSMYLPTALTTTYTLRLLSSTLSTESKSMKMATPSQNTHSRSLTAPAFTIMQALPAVTFGAATALIWSPTSQLLTPLYQNTMILLMSLTGTFILMMLKTNLKLAPTMKMAKLSHLSLTTLYSNMSMWNAMKTTNTKFLSISLNTFKLTDNTTLSTPLKIPYSLTMLVSQLPTFHKMKMAYPMMLSAISLLPLFLMQMYAFSMNKVHLPSTEQATSYSSMSRFDRFFKAISTAMKITDLLLLLLGLICLYLIKTPNLLTTLLLLEVTSLATTATIMLIHSLPLTSTVAPLLMLLTMGAAEASIGLAILTTMLHTWGMDKTNSMNMLFL